ncbi:MAG: bacillithiol biosynthesis cysteine-adding enzyme BshC [Acidobacteriia bacterium]|nr:bacillithiol biosynthesis cysteine-adding enzyme BshC [Terriglobia bacterium]
MKPGCIRQTDLPNTSALFADLVYHFDRVAPFYEHYYLDRDCYAEAAGKIAYPEGRRHALVAALGELNDPCPQLELLARHGTVAVVTGQQVGLFSGPCYTIYKALTAARLAAQLTSRGIPAVPVFWLATEDHDFEEINHAWVFDANKRPHQFSVEAGGMPNRPVGGIAPESYPTGPLREALAGHPFGAAVSAMVEEAYQPGSTMGQAFAHLLRSLLPDLGLLYLDPMQPSIRSLAAPLLREAVHAGPLLGEKLLHRNQQLQEAGYHAQVHIEAKTSLFFLLENGQRHTLRRDGDMYANGRIRFTSGELASRADHISPNAVLRPVVQDYLLPTVAMIGGPAELAYLAQTQVIYHELGQRAPVVVPRNGFTLLDGRAVKLMERYHLTAKDFFGGLNLLRSQISEHLVPPPLRQSLQSAKEQTSTLLDSMQTELAAFDATLGEATAKSRSKILHQLAKIEAKTARECLRRDERASAEADYLHHLIYPNNHLQERIYAMLPFLAQHGPDLVHRIRESVHLDCPDHMMLAV